MKCEYCDREIAHCYFEGKLYVVDDELDESWNTGFTAHSCNKKFKELIKLRK